jgi:hypothetical protein
MVFQLGIQTSISRVKAQGGDIPKNEGLDKALAFVKHEAKVI